MKYLNLNRNIGRLPLTPVQELIGRTPSEILDIIASEAAKDDILGIAYTLRLGLFPLHLDRDHACDGSIRIERMSAWRDIRIDMNEIVADATQRIHRQLSFIEPQCAITLTFTNWTFESGDALSQLGLDLSALASRCRRFELKCQSTRPIAPAILPWMSANSASWGLNRDDNDYLAIPDQPLDLTSIKLAMLRSEGAAQLLTSPMRVIAFETPLMRSVFIDTSAAEFGHLSEGDAWTRRPLFMHMAPAMEDLVLYGRLTSLVFAVEHWTALRRMEVSAPLSVHALVRIAEHCTAIEQLYIHLADIASIVAIPVGVRFASLKSVVATSEYLLDVIACQIGCPVLEEIWLAIDDLDEQFALQLAAYESLARIGPHNKVISHQAVLPCNQLNAARARTTYPLLELILSDIMAAELERFFTYWSQEGRFEEVQRIVLRRCQLSPFNLTMATVVARHLITFGGDLTIEDCTLERGKEARPDNTMELLDAFVTPILANDFITVKHL